MASPDLIFSRSPLTGLPVHLVFGESDGPTVPDVTLHGAGKITGLRLRVAVRTGASLHGAGKITGLRLRVAVVYDVAVSRPTTTQAHARYQEAQGVQTGAQDRYQQAQPTSGGTAAHWQNAQAVSVAVHALWQDCERLAIWARTRWQDAASLPTAPLLSAYQEALRTRTGAAARWQEATRLPVPPVSARYQEALHLRLGGSALYQDAAPLRASVISHMGTAVLVFYSAGGRYQEAWPPRPGRSTIFQPLPQVPGPCYLPSTHLVFKAPWPASTHLVFVCERAALPPPGGTVVVPIRRVYMIFNSVTLYRVDTGAALRALSFSMSLNDGSWTWNWEASLHESARNHLGRDGSGRPAELAVVVNGVNFRLLLENRAKDERFSPELRFSVSGRGKAAMLDEAYAPSMNFGNTADRTAQQLAAEVLTINGAPIGWDIEWGLTDWFVPGGAWTFQGTYISAINDIATAAGGYVQPHNTDAMLRILPRYPAAPWDWGSVTPDVVIPRMTAEVVSTDYVDKPVYNQVHVGGIAAGVFGPWKRAGTAGDREAPQVTHALITHADAQRQRARAVLSDTGSQALISLSMQVRPESGVIMPGKYIRYQGDEEVMGIVRGVTLNWNRPTLRQVLRVETHE